jgi:hypothetical protein
MSLLHLVPFYLKMGVVDIGIDSYITSGILLFLFLTETLTAIIIMIIISKTATATTIIVFLDLFGDLYSTC